VALNYIPDFKTVFIDNSSTCLALAVRMNLAHKTVITNGLQIATKLCQKDNVQILMPGGSVLYNTNSVMGSMAIDGIKKFRFDLMLSSCAALNETGSYENSVDTATLKRVAIEQSKRRILLADSSKIGNFATFHTSDLNRYDLKEKRFWFTRELEKTVRYFSLNRMKSLLCRQIRLLVP